MKIPITPKNYLWYGHDIRIFQKRANLLIIHKKSEHSKIQNNAIIRNARNCGKKLSRINVQVYNLEVANCAKSILSGSFTLR